VGLQEGIKIARVRSRINDYGQRMDEEDEFVDAVSENDESVNVNGSDEEKVAVDEDDGFGDDDFGDFAAQEDEEDVEEEGHEEYDLEIEQQTQKLEEVRISQPIIQQSPLEPPKPPLVHFPRQ
jgi:hypothetical protein